MAEPPFRIEGPLGPRTRVDGRDVDYFCGTSYHCLHGHPEVIEAANAANLAYGVGLGTRADVPVYTRLSEALCTFFEAEAVIHSISGYVMPLILLQGLEAAFDRVFVDRAAHYGIRDACATLDQPVHRFAHRDPQALSEALARHLVPGEVAMIVTDGVFPTTGALAPLADYVAVMEGYEGAMLCVDDAHGVGAIGPGGRGAMALAGIEGPGRYLSATTSKAFGGTGGFIPGTSALTGRLAAEVPILAGATPPTPAAAAAAAAGVELVQGEGGLLARLAENVQRMRSGLRGLGLEIEDSPVPIVNIAADRDLADVRDALAAEGILIKRVRPGGYSDAPDHETLRIAVFSAHTDVQIDRLVAAMAAAL